MFEGIRCKPHILIAFAWIMFMAIFSGGRWIRQQYADSRCEFWTGQLNCKREEKQGRQSRNLSGFRFLSFEGEHDGEDIKSEFKARLAEADALLTVEERQDVVQAARELFDSCITLVGLLDRSVGQRSVLERMNFLLFWLSVLEVVFVLGCGLRHLGSLGWHA